MKKEVIVFKKLIAPGQKFTFKERVKDNGMIDSLRVRFYSGVEESLEIQCYVNHKINRREDFLTYNEGGENFLSGNDDYFIYPVNVEVEYDDEIVVEVKNNDATYSYTCSVDVIVAYDGGEY